MKSAKKGTAVRLKPSTLRRWVLLGTGTTTLVGTIVFLIFAQLQSTNGKWLWQDGFQLDGSQWFDAARTTVTLVGIIGLGGAAFLAYRRQVSTEATHLLEQSSGLRDRYTTCAEQLAHESVAIRLAGVYALASLADDWHEYGNDRERQVCIDLLCAYLRTPSTHTTTQQPPVPARPTGRTLAGHRHLRPSNPTQPPEMAPDHEVRIAIQTVIGDHLQATAEASWSACSFDFHSAVLVDLNLAGTVFRGTVSFVGVQFHGALTSFSDAQFHSELTSFDGAQFHSERTSFDEAEFRSERTLFVEAEFHGELTSFDGAQFRGELTWFVGAQFRSDLTSFGGVQFRSERTSFIEAEFRSDLTSFGDAQFYSDLTSFGGVQFHGEWTSFDDAQFHGDRTVFGGAQFRSDLTSFGGAQFHGEWTLFVEAQFHGDRTVFGGAQFHGEWTSFKDPGAWNRVYFDWDPRPPYAPTATKPDSVLPEVWPPTVHST